MYNLLENLIVINRLSSIFPKDCKYNFSKDCKIEYVYLDQIIK